MDLITLLSSLEIFDGLTEAEIATIATICSPYSQPKNSLLAIQDNLGDDLFIITEGFAEVSVTNPTSGKSRSLVNLGPGQLFGEMALIDQGLRSATVRSISDPIYLYRIRHADFEKICSENTRIGYIVMRNLAKDLSFKLRHQNLQDY